MNTIRILLACVVLLAASLASAADGLISVKSPYGAKETMDRLEGIVKQRGLNVFARIDHAAGAAKVGKNLRPTEVLIFGNPQGGTPFMECAQSVGIDLPLKALVWQDADNQVWLSYNDPEYLAKRHEVANCQIAVNLSKALAEAISSVAQLAQLSLHRVHQRPRLSGFGRQERPESGILRSRISTVGR